MNNDLLAILSIVILSVVMVGIGSAILALYEYTLYEYVNRKFATKIRVINEDGTEGYVDGYCYKGKINELIFRMYKWYFGA